MKVLKTLEKSILFVYKRFEDNCKKKPFEFGEINSIIKEDMQKEKTIDFGEINSTIKEDMWYETQQFITLIPNKPTEL